MFTIMILTSGLNACKSRRGVTTQKTDILNSTHWSLRKSLIHKIDNMSKLGYPSQKSQKLRYFERKEVILAFTRNPHAMAAMSKWCETKTNTSVHCGRSTHTTWSVTLNNKGTEVYWLRQNCLKIWMKLFPGGIYGEKHKSLFSAPDEWFRLKEA